MQLARRTGETDDRRPSRGRHHARRGPRGFDHGGPVGNHGLLAGGARTASRSRSGQRRINGLTMAAIRSPARRRAPAPPGEAATTSSVRSSAVGPSPPLVTIRSSPWSAMKQAGPRTSWGLSPQKVMWAARRRAPAGGQPARGRWRRSTRPVSTSVPVTTIPARDAWTSRAGPGAVEDLLGPRRVIRSPSGSRLSVMFTGLPLAPAPPPACPGSSAALGVTKRAWLLERALEDLSVPSPVSMHSVGGRGRDRSTATPRGAGWARRRRGGCFGVERSSRWLVRCARSPSDSGRPPSEAQHQEARDDQHHDGAQQRAGTGRAGRARRAPALRCARLRCGRRRRGATSGAGSRSPSAASPGCGSPRRACAGPGRRPRRRCAGRCVTKVGPGSSAHSSFSSARRYFARIFVRSSRSAMSSRCRIRAPAECPQSAAWPLLFWRIGVQGPWTGPTPTGDSSRAASTRGRSASETSTLRAFEPS